MFTLSFWLVFGINYPCHSASVESPGVRLMRPDWAFITKTQDVACNASKLTDADLLSLGLNPFDALEHEAGPDGLEID